MKLVVGVSGGRTSAYMAHLIRNNLSKFSRFDDVEFIFANTGQENNETLDFVRECCRAFDLNITWLEAVVHPGRVACTHKVVDYETAHRISDPDFQKAPYFQVVKKYGLANKAYPHCTRELKENPIKSYVREQGHTELAVALGMRTDEPKRVHPSPKKLYPLVDLWPSDRLDIADFWERASFDLGLEDYRGNCAWCFKKSKSKLLRIAKERPEVFTFPCIIEELFSKVGPNKINGELVEEGRTIFREYMTARDLLKTAHYLNDSLRAGYPAESCGTDCQAFADDEDLAL